MLEVLTEKYALFHGDCLDLLPKLGEAMPGAVDLVLCDMPYGTTQCKWDQIIPMEKLWPMLKRVAKKNAAFVFTASQPFTSVLVMSNVKDFRYGLVWEKTKKTGFLNVKKQFLRKHEDISVFGCGPLTYNPQGTTSCDKIVDRGSPEGTGDCYGNATPLYRQTTENYPNSIILIPSEGKTVHPTQKPVDLMAYLIRTYTNPGETVLDFTMGSGTTGVACLREGRNFIGIEKDEAYFKGCVDRLAAAMAEAPAP